MFQDLTPESNGQHHEEQIDLTTEGAGGAEVGEDHRDDGFAREMK